MPRLRLHSLPICLFALLQSLLVLPTCTSAQSTVEEIGHYSQIALPITALGISVLKQDKQGVIQFTKSVLVESVLVYGLKQVIDRERPNGRSFSFPSGHTAISFTSATYLYERYGWQYGVPATIVASFVGYSRFGPDEPVHYFSDVAAGAALGIVTSLIFTARKMDTQNLSITGSWDSDSAALAAVITF